MRRQVGELNVGITTFLGIDMTISFGPRPAASGLFWIVTWNLTTPKSMESSGASVAPIASPASSAAS